MHRHILPLDNEINTEYGLGQQSEDKLSLMPGQREKDSLDLLSDNEGAISCSSSDPSVTENRNSSFVSFWWKKDQKKFRMYCLIFFGVKNYKILWHLFGSSSDKYLGEILALFSS